MKLYYSQGACSLSPHIALLEAGLPFDLIKVDLKSKQTQTGQDFLAINSKGYVPVLELDDHTVLTEGPAILQYIADAKPDRHLAPAPGTRDRYTLQEWLNFITSELHKTIGALFNKDMPDAWHSFMIQLIEKRLNWLVSDLGSKPYLMNTFTVADCYLYTVLRWTRYVDVKLTPWPTLAAYVERMEARPEVRNALKAEAILK